MINEEIKYNILIKGALSSGSSAVKDLLREYNNVNVVPDEFDDFRAPGLVSDYLVKTLDNTQPHKLESYIKFQKRKLWYLRILLPKFCYKAGLQLNILNKVVLSLTNLNLKNKYKHVRCKLTLGLEYLVRLLSDKLIRINHLFYLEELNKQLKPEITLEMRIQFSNEWIRKISSINSKGKSFSLFDQPILLINNTEIWGPVFSPFKLICVFRDPKDQLADMIDRGILYDPYSLPRMTYTKDNILSIYGHDRKGMLKFLIDALRQRLYYFDRLEDELEQNQFLLIDFEGLIHKYDEYKSKIEVFLNISGTNHIFKRKYFDPEISRSNIGIYKQYLSDKEIGEISDLDLWYKTKLEKIGASAL